MNAASFDRAVAFLRGEGRLLERRLFACRFEGASPGAVVDVLAGYRNADGGFGHGLEPDKRAPDSQPLDVEVAFEALAASGAAGAAADLVHGACDFLAGVDSGTGGVPCLLPSAQEHPRAPHWDGAPSAADLNPTASLCGYLWQWGVDHPWRDAATAFCWSRLGDGIPRSAHTVVVALRFLAHVPEHARADALVDDLEASLAEVEMLHLEPPTDGSYGLSPLDLVRSPDDRWRRLFGPGVIERHLDAIERSQCEDGGWPISWPTIGAAAAMEYRGVVTLRALMTLRAFGRVPSSASA